MAQPSAERLNAAQNRHLTPPRGKRSAQQRSRATTTRGEPEKSGVLSGPAFLRQLETRSSRPSLSATRPAASSVRDGRRTASAAISAEREIPGTHNDGGVNQVAVHPNANVQDMVGAEGVREGTEDWMPQIVDDSELPPDDSELPPDSSAGVLESLRRQQREQEKENVYGKHEGEPRKPRAFIDPQENAVRVSFDEDGLDAQRDQQLTHGGRRTGDEGANDDEDAEAVFQSDDRPVEEHRQRASRSIGKKRSRRTRVDVASHDRSTDEPEPPRRTDATTQRRLRSAGGQVPSSNTRPDESRAPQIVDDGIHPSQVNTLAKASVASRSSRKVQVRRPWDEPSTSRLIELIEDDDYGTSWTKIAALRDPLLDGRGQVALKDKARNIKLDFLKAGIALPVNFENVRLSRMQIQALHKLGVDYQQEGFRAS